MTKDDIILMADASGIAYYGMGKDRDKFVHYLAAFANLVAAQPEQEPCIGKDPRCPCQDGDACHYKDCKATKALPVPVAQPEQEPTPRRDMIVATLVREGIDKHKARELADHFAAQPEPPPKWDLINNIIAEYGLQAIDFVSDWKAAQRPWQGLTDEDKQTAVWTDGTFGGGALWAQQLLKERNG